VQRVGSEAELREVYAQPGEVIRRKVMRQLDAHSRRFIELSPFCCIGTCAPSGADVSPRGDAPGFVRVLTPRQLLVPDRIGNNRVDSLRNLLEDERVGMLFLVPGLLDMLRVNGRGRVTMDEALLRDHAVDGRAPRSALLVDVEEAFFHCGRAAKRARLWDPAAQVERSAMPRLGDVLRDQIASDDGSLDETFDRLREETYLEHLY
jgi:PPOX class probable FMN-dependent enzyme